MYCRKRPTEKDCPTIVYVREPDPLVCGVKPNGERVDFPRECEACKDRSVVFYMETPCDFAPLICREEEKCVGHECVSKCKAKSDCPFNWQNCIANECRDPCITMRCRDCKYGICGYQEPNEKCFFDRDCEDPNHSCVTQLCVDKCIRIRCPAGFTCFKGICRP